MNRLVHAHRAEVDAYLRAAATLRDAQFAGKGDLTAATRSERAALEELVGLGGESVRSTLQAAAVDDNTAREVLDGRLVREPEPAGFGTLLAHAEPAAAKPGKNRATKTLRRDDKAAGKRLQEAERVLTAAEAEERRARDRLTQTQRELERAQAAVEKARRELKRLQDR